MVVLLPFLVSLIAGLSTGIGSLIAFFVKDIGQQKISLFLGFSAGVITYISFTELLFSSIREIGFIYANLAFFVGILAMAFIDFSIPHQYGKEEVDYKKDHEKKNMLRTGVIVALGIAIHNFPEGMATFFATLKNFNLGILLMVAISLHNIPEGLSVCVPIYCATGQKKKAFYYSFLSGIAEPLGALIGFLILYPFFGYSEYLLNGVLAFVAGVMIFISFDEILPTSINQGGGHTSIASLFLGMGSMFFAMLLLH